MRGPNLRSYAAAYSNKLNLEGARAPSDLPKRATNGTAKREKQHRAATAELAALWHTPKGKS